MEDCGTKSWSRLYNDDDLEAQPEEYSATARHGFIRKVFGILSLQLLITSLIGTIFIASREVQEYVYTNRWTLWLAIVLSFALLIAIYCIPNAQQSYPTNLILLGLFTVMEGYLVGAVVASYDVVPVLIAFFLTFAVTLGLTLFALQTKIDFTMWGGFLFSILLVLLLTGILSVFVRLRILDFVYSGAGAILFSLYLVYDVQLIAGGRKYAFSIDDYVPAALSIYLDVINMFVLILQFVNNVRG